MPISAGFSYGRDVLLKRGLRQPKKPFFFLVRGQTGGNRASTITPSPSTLHGSLHRVKSGTNAQSITVGNMRKTRLLIYALVFKKRYIWETRPMFFEIE